MKHGVADIGAEGFGAGGGEGERGGEGGADGEVGVDEGGDAAHGFAKVGGGEGCRVANAI